MISATSATSVPIELGAAVRRGACRLRDATQVCVTPRTGLAASRAQIDSGLRSRFMSENGA